MEERLLGAWKAKRQVEHSWIGGCATACGFLQMLEAQLSEYGVYAGHCQRRSDSWIVTAHTRSRLGRRK